VFSGISISAIIPTYNNSNEELQRIAQIISSFSDVDEFIIIDDASQRDMVEQLKSLFVGTDKVTLLFNEENHGAAYTRNRGLEKARGEYVAFLDSDDYWHPQKLALQVSMMMRIGAKICGTQHRVIASQTELEAVCQERYSTDEVPYHQVSWHQALFRSPFSTPSVVLHRDVFSRIRFNEQYRYAEDYEYWLRILHGYPAIKIELPLTYTFKHDYLGDGRSLSVELGRMQKAQNTCYRDLLGRENVVCRERIVVFAAFLVAQVKYLRRVLLSVSFRRKSSHA